MGNIKVYLLVLLIGIPEVVSQNEECDAESQVKMSALSALRHSLTAKKPKMAELQASIDIKEAEVAKLKAYLSTTLEEAETIITAIHNKTTPDIQGLETTCDLEGTLAIDCCQVKTMLPLVETGLYSIRDPSAGDKVFNNAKMHVRCNMETDGGGWIVIQRRNASLGRVQFNRNWKDYENGFGDLDGEFWIGLKNIHELTTQQEMELQISVWNDTNTRITRNYHFFRVSGPAHKYQLTVSTGTGDGNRDAFRYNNRQYFTTYDCDYSGNHCGHKDQGGWWYNRCTGANLNGRHVPSGLRGTRQIGQRLVWNSGNGREIYTHSEMKIRPQTCGLK